MSSGIFFCKRPNSICLLTGTKTIREPRETGFLVSLEKGQRQSRRRGRKEDGRRGWWRESGGGQRGDTDNRAPPPARCGWLVLVMMNGDAAQHQVPAVKALRRTRQREEVSLSAGLLGQPGLCWVLLLESSQQIKHHNTHPSPNTATHTARPPPLSGRMC